jgi:hypothetical protein
MQRRRSERNRILTIALGLLMATSLTSACSDDGSEGGGEKADQKTSNLVAKDVSSVTKEVGDQAGAKAGKADIDVSGESLGGSIPGSAGAVDISGSVKAGATGFDIEAALDFKGYQGQGGVAITGKLTATYTLEVDVSNPLAPSVKFNSTVKGRLTTADGKVVEIDISVKSENGTLTCSGGANGFAMATDCAGGSTPNEDGGTPTPDMGTPSDDTGAPSDDIGAPSDDIGGSPDLGIPDFGIPDVLP